MAGATGGLEAVDVHHRVQASLVDLVEQLLRRGGDRALAEETITRLVDFTAAHFQAEERLMSEYAYPQAEGHGAEHARLLVVLRGIQSAHAAQGAEGPEQATRLRSWLSDHIANMDKTFLEWCAATGARPA